ncbi:MAG: Lar family restriction alleviation protein [Eubacteriales bacterium]
MNNEIKKCPFCGGEAKLHDNTAIGWGVEVVCNKCWASTKKCMETEKIAIAAWNRRVADEVDQE